MMITSKVRQPFNALVRCGLVRSLRCLERSWEPGLAADVAGWMKAVVCKLSAIRPILHPLLLHFY